MQGLGGTDPRSHVSNGDEMLGIVGGQGAEALSVTGKLTVEGWWCWGLKPHPPNPRGLARSLPLSYIPSQQGPVFPTLSNIRASRVLELSGA